MNFTDHQYIQTLLDCSPKLARHHMRNAMRFAPHLVKDIQDAYDMITNADPRAKFRKLWGKCLKPEISNNRLNMKSNTCFTNHSNNRFTN